MNKLAELLGLRAQIAELENEINNEVISFTKEELIEFTKTISNAVANGVKFELSKKDNFDFAGALYTKRNSEVMGGLEVKVSRGRVLSEVVDSIDWVLDEENVESVVETVLEGLGK
jgi:hypothetical protein